MPELAFYAGFVLVVVVATGSALERKKVRRSRRVAVWAALALMLPFSFLAFCAYMLSVRAWRPW